MDVRRNTYTVYGYTCVVRGLYILPLLLNIAILRKLLCVAEGREATEFHRRINNDVSFEFAAR